MATPRHILVFRFSALGDIAMTVPVIRLVLAQHPGLEITFVSTPFVQPLFAGIDRLHFYPADTKKDFNGLAGLYRLAAQLKNDVSFDAVADLHDVLRTKIIRWLLPGRSVAVVNKGRREKKELTRPHHKKLRPLPTGFQRYAAVFESLGLPVNLDSVGAFTPRPAGDLPFGVVKTPGRFLVGIAPFARHAAKMYPVNKMEGVIRELITDPSISVILFGSKDEQPLLRIWEELGPAVVSVAGKGSLQDELRVISALDVMVSMDSANMHLASLFGIPVVSVWGGTHPWLGFYGWRQDYENAIQTDLPCRPSSVFGNKPCPVHGEAGCMQEITPSMITERVRQNLKQRAASKNN